MDGTVISVNLSEKKGTVKRPISRGRLVAGSGLEGDAHAGPWHRQVSLLAQESIDKMREYGLDELEPGIFAENITTQGIVLNTLPVGERLQIGECVLRVTQIGKECAGPCEVARRVGKCVMPTEGIFAEVLTGGEIAPGMPIQRMGV